MPVCRALIVMLLPGLAALSARSAELRFAGVLGNSGGEGPTVVRAAPGRPAGGVVVDPQGRIFTGGSDRILVLSRRGTLLWETPLPKPGWVLGGPTFAVAGQYLYFVAGPPARYEGNYNFLWNPFTLLEPHLCRVEMTPGATPAILAVPSAFRWNSPWWGGEVSLAPAPGGGSVYVGLSPARTDNGRLAHDGYCVMQVQPDGTLTTRYESPLNGGRLAVDESGCVYLGGGETVRKFNLDWQPAPDFTPTALPRLGAVPTRYIGAVMLTKEALWETGHYGFIGRYTRAMQPHPGVVTQWEHALNWVAQIADAPDGAYYIKSDDALYLAAIEDDRLVLRKRFGSLPRVNCLVLTSAGYVGVGADARLLWFDFAAEACAAAPVKAEFPGPIAQGLADGEAGLLALSVNPGYQPQEYVPAPRGIALSKYAAEPPKEGGNQARSLATGEFDGRLDAIARVGAWQFALDCQHGRLVRAEAKAPCAFTPVARAWPTAPTSIAALAGELLLVAAGGWIQACAPGADGTLAEVWTWNGGASPVEQFGPELQLAVSGNALLVADTRRHCVRLFTFADRTEHPPTPVACYGEVDLPGDDFAHFNAPGLVSLSGGRAVVYDSGNQRVTKLVLR